MLYLRKQKEIIMTVNNEIEKYVFKPSNKELESTLLTYHSFIVPSNNPSDVRKAYTNIATRLHQRDKVAYRKFINANSGLVQLLDNQQGFLASHLWNLETFYMPDIKKIVEDYSAMQASCVEIAKNPYTPDAVKRQSANELFALAKNIAEAFDTCYQNNMNEILTANEFNRQNPNNPPYPDIARALEQHPSVIADYNMRQKSMQDLQAEGKTK